MTNQVMILAGGLGTRLRKVVNNKPKVLAEINGIPFLELILKQINKEGYKEVNLLIGYKGHMIKSYFGDNFKDIKIIYTQEKELLGTGGAIKNAANNSPDNKLLILNGDTYHSISKRCFTNKAIKCKNAIVCKKIKDPSRYGVVKMNEKNLIINFNEKNIIEGTFYINTGTYLLDKEKLLTFNKKIFSLEKEYFPILIKEQILEGVILDGDFIDIGIPEDLEKAQRLLR